MARTNSSPRMADSLVRPWPWEKGWKEMAVTDCVSQDGCALVSHTEVVGSSPRGSYSNKRNRLQSENQMFLNLTLASGRTSPIIASGILNPAHAYLPCSKALHVKCRLLPEDLITSPDIGTNSVASREK
jgi:hypothetical protein